MAFLANFGFGIQMVPLPLYTADLGASVLVLGMLGGATAAVYTCGCFATGVLVRLLPTRGLTLIGSAVSGTALILLGQAETVQEVFKAACTSAAGLSIFWVSMETWLGESGDAKSLPRRTAAFNVSWCSGLIAGPWLGGILFDRYAQLPFFCAAAALFTCTLLVSLVVGSRFTNRSRRDDYGLSFDPTELAKSDRLLPVVWLAQFTQWLSVSMIRYIWPKLANDQGFEPAAIGRFLAVVGLAQTITFAIMGIVHFWRFRRYLIYAVQIIAATAIAAMAVTANQTILYAAFAVVGIGTAFIYKSSIYYSLYHPKNRGFRSSMHEGLLASGALVGPIYAGTLAHLAFLSLPFILMPAIVLTSVIVQGRIYNRKN